MNSIILQLHYIVIDKGGAMEEKIVHVTAISCGHCSNTIERELGDLEGVTFVGADPVTKDVTVKWEPPADWQTISATLTEIGYPADS